MSDRFTQCKEAVLAYADYLIERIKAGKLNASAFEGLVVVIHRTARVRCHIPPPLTG